MHVGPDGTRAGVGRSPGPGAASSRPLGRRVAGALAVAVAGALLTAGCATGAPRPAPSAARAQPAPAAAASPTEAPAGGPTPVDLPPVTVVGTAPVALRPVVAPVRVSIPGHSVDMRIVPVGVAADGRMALPPNPVVAGWYRYGPDARAAHGSIVVAAHVDSIEYGLGPFVQLRSLPKGALVRIRDASGRTDQYRVDEVRHVRKADLAKAGVFDRGGDRRLTLVTCGGTFDTRTRTYSDNVIVIARVVDR